MIAIYPFEGGLPTGLIFASFMVCITIGGVVYSALGMDAAVESYSFICLLAAFGAMALCALGAPAAVMPQILPALGDFGPTLAAFLVLESCVGCFNACAGTMRSRYIPEDVQAAVMNLGRVPLNLLVVGGTYLSDAAPAQVAFAAVALAFLGGAVLQAQLVPAKRD